MSSYEKSGYFGIISSRKAENSLLSIVPLVAQETALEAPERRTWHKFSIVLGWCLQGFGTVYMHWHSMDDVLDPVLQQFYLSSSSHSSSVLKGPHSPKMHCASHSANLNFVWHATFKPSKICYHRIFFITIGSYTYMLICLCKYLPCSTFYSFPELFCTYLVYI